MRIRPYIESRDYGYLEKWIDDERNHALWCADLLPYPVTKESLHLFLEKNAMDRIDSAYVATEDNGKVIGFFCYSINIDDNTGFLKLVIVDHEKRRTGCGKEMLRSALRYAFDITGVEAVRLNVFEENVAARHCYEKVGFLEKNVSKNVFSFKGERWSRCQMIETKERFLETG